MHDFTEGKSITTCSMIFMMLFKLNRLLLAGLQLKQQLWQDAVHLSVVTNAKDLGSLCKLDILMLFCFKVIQYANV